MPTNHARAIDDALAIAEHEWRSHGVQRGDLAVLAADLRCDLQAAAADGVDPEQVLGPDVRVFARRLADDAGARRIPYDYRRLLLTALAGAVPGVVLGYVLLSGFWFVVAVDVPVQFAIVLLYAAAPVGIIAGALIAVWVRMRDVPRIRPTVGAMGVLLPATGLIMAPVTIGLAWLTDFSTVAPVLLLEAALVAAALAGAVIVARRWALRDSIIGAARMRTEAAG